MVDRKMTCRLGAAQTKQGGVIVRSQGRWPWQGRARRAGAASELGDAFQYVALMWFALVAGGPLAVMAVRLADSVPALLFGLHGGLVADRWDRRRLMIASDLFRALVLVP